MTISLNDWIPYWILISDSTQTFFQGAPAWVTEILNSRIVRMVLYCAQIRNLKTLSSIFLWVKLLLAKSLLVLGVLSGLIWKQLKVNWDELRPLLLNRFLLHSKRKWDEHRWKWIEIPTNPYLDFVQIMKENHLKVDSNELTSFLIMFCFLEDLSG